MSTTVSITGVLSGQVKIISDRFDAKVQKGEGCWLWLGGVGTTGYGRFSVHGKYRPAHRMVYEFVCGRLPSSIYVCHTCDNPRCVRPNHLFAGTPAENTQDMMDKGRNRWGVNSQPGESNPAAVLTERDVELILALVFRDVPQKVAAEVFGVSISEVSDIVRGRRWNRN